MIDVIFAASVGMSSPFLASKLSKFGKIKLFSFGFGVGLFFSLISVAYYHFFGLQNIHRGTEFYLSAETIIPGLIFPFSFGIMAVTIQWMHPLMTWKQAEQEILRSGFGIVESQAEYRLKYSKNEFDLIAFIGPRNIPTHIKIFRRNREIGIIELRS